MAVPRPFLGRSSCIKRGSGSTNPSPGLWWAPRRDVLSHGATQAASSLGPRAQWLPGSSSQNCGWRQSWTKLTFRQSGVPNSLGPLPVAIKVTNWTVLEPQILFLPSEPCPTPLLLAYTWHSIFKNQFNWNLFKTFICLLQEDKKPTGFQRTLWKTLYKNHYIKNTTVHSRQQSLSYKCK